MLRRNSPRRHISLCVHITVPPPVIEPLYVEEKVVTTPQIETKATLVQTDKCEPQTAQVVKITKDMVELEHEMHENTKIAIDNYKVATQFCTDYNKALFKRSPRFTATDEQCPH
ncbi:hypothetical protein HF086_011307 [Spodoptera exigua]|uniref:Uncharacterized protein n=1 Tax=Spodoptera exigua TaxID=7107 RepID=A0A922MFL2_SPOEX|nr:hypothetical protein HF086_011307 [Spodoptera exigua]